MKKLFMIIFAILLFAMPVMAELNNVTSEGVDGNLVFYDVSKNEIFTIDATNRRLSIPAGSSLYSSATDITLRGVTYTLPEADGTVGQMLATDGSATLSWSSAGTTATDIALTADGDFGDYDVKSIDGLYGYDDAIYIDMGTDGALSIVSDGTISINSGDWDISTTGVITNASMSADQISAAALTLGNYYLSIGTDPADAGTIRLPNAGSIQFEADATGTDVNAISVDSSEIVQIGSSGASGVTITPDTTFSGNVTVTGIYYHSAIAPATGNLTLNGAGTGTVSIGNTSTGAIILTGGGVDIGDGATDTLTITGIVDSNITLDDGTTDSPHLIFKDSDDETAAIYQDQSSDDLNVDCNDAADSLAVTTGNLSVGTPNADSISINGGDLYVSDDMEVDGSTVFDGTVEMDALLTATAGTTISGGTINLNASSNNAVNIGTGTTTSTVTIGGAGNQSINIGNGAAVKAVALGSDNTTSSTTIKAGTGDLSITSVNDLTINGGSAGSIITVGGNTDGNEINIGADDTTADTITVGSAKDTSSLAGISVTVGSTGTTSATAVQSGSGGVNINASNNQPTNINSGTSTGTVTIGGTGIMAIDIGTGGTGAKTITIGDGASTGTTAIKSGSGGVALNASVNNPVNIGTGTSTGTVTIGGTAAQSIAIGDGAAAKTVTLGSTNTTSTTTINAGSGNINLVGTLATGDAITGDGTAALGGFLKTVTDDIDGKTLNVTESGTVQTNAGASGAAAWTLPAAAVGLNYCFVVMAAQELRVTPAAGDKIVHDSTVMDAAEYYYADAIGESLCIVAVDGTNWIMMSSTGTWAEETP